jgi:hypothetical protein
MWLRYVSVTAAILAAFVGVYIASNLPRHDHEGFGPTPDAKGRNNTVLFVSSSEYGLSNVFLATSYAMMVHHPEVQVHYATFNARERDISALSSVARSKSPNAKPIIYHELSGLSLGDRLIAHGKHIEGAMQPPGLEAVIRLCKDMQTYLMPWDAPEYFELYSQIVDIIEEVDPAVVAADTLFGPGLDAARQTGRRNAIVSPNALKDNFADKQPFGEMFWKFPA